MIGSNQLRQALRLSSPRFWTALFVFLAFVCVVAPSYGQRGAFTERRNLEQLVSQADVIVRGQVVSARVERHPEFRNLWTVVVTLRVEETLKGSLGRQYTFRQFIWDPRDRLDAAGYRKGQSLLLLMNKTTPYGLTSPTGLEQGRFRLTRDTQGRETAVNGYGNAGLLQGLDKELPRQGIRLPPHLAAVVSGHRGGPISADDLSDLIRRLARTQ